VLKTVNAGMVRDIAGIERTGLKKEKVLPKFWGDKRW
jgi:hypothetical protein